MGGGYFLANSKNFQLNKSKKSAFSLIELSIVLIIIGLLVAGVTGGASLIKSAKTRALINEIRNYKQAINSFYVEKGRLPGDANGDGDVNSSDGGLYNFSAPFADVESPISAPWVELYLAGIIDFKLDPTCDGYTNDSECRGRPASKVYKEYEWDIDSAVEGYGDDDSYLYNFSKNMLRLFGDYPYNSISISAKTAKQIDEKIDDGQRVNGSMRSACDTNNSWDVYDKNLNYEDLDEESTCPRLAFRIDFE